MRPANRRFRVGQMGNYRSDCSLIVSGMQSPEGKNHLRPDDWRRIGGPLDKWRNRLRAPNNAQGARGAPP